MQTRNRTTESQAKPAARRSPARLFRSSRPVATGFTLIELLVVIIIIAILAAILIPAVNAARLSARRAVVATDVMKLGEAIEAHRNLSGQDYPSDFADLQLSPPQYGQRTKDHLARAYPRHDRAVVNTWLTTNYAGGTMQDPRKLDPAEALVFWLGLVKNDQKYPVCAANGSIIAMSLTSGRPPLFTFDQTRLRDRDGDGWYEYYPTGIDDAPFVYFLHAAYSVASYPSPAPAAGVSSPIGVARPYQTAGGAFLQPTSFQIIAAGFDNNFGDDTVVNAPNAFKQAPSQAGPSGLHLGVLDWDNITNFSNKGTIESMKP
jgi:prepilin-type N-terminal cleavage/methylation domain-containing protein